MTDDRLPDTDRERAAFRQRELGRADPLARLIQASEHDPGHPARDSHERAALVEALMLLTHRVGELARIVAKTTKPPGENGGGPHE